MDINWKTHEKHSDEKWGTVRIELNKINAKLDELPCEKVMERVRNTDRRIDAVIKGLYFVLTILIIAIGAPILVRLLS